MRSALELGHDGVSHSQESGGGQCSVGLAIDLSHRRPFFWYCVQEDYSPNSVVKVYSVRHKVLKEHVHPLHIGVQIVGQ